ncbi:sulfhydryl oxidase 2-like [Pectinophora gossypiella]|uniref:sulfhydryl oxidase 2-like n=1 Tax=Pectinophora gossypiella TaxID=13191 RepID=UPI00214EBF48|nr:sulfhydryl oxidase 2-like [Pectinophora gossypiella]
MGCWQFLALFVSLSVTIIYGAVISDDGDVAEQGLYSKSDHVIILTGRNFGRKIYAKPYAQVVQFYSSGCGHCRAFSPKFKTLASEVIPWQKVVRLAVIDCANEDNLDACRDFQVMAYPTIRFLHEQFLQGPNNIGQKIQIPDTVEKLKGNIISNLQAEQQSGRLATAPSLAIGYYNNYAEAFRDVPNNILHYFLIFENANSTVGSELILDMIDYKDVHVKRVYDNCDLASIAQITHSPGLVVVSKPTLQPSNLTPNVASKQNVVKAITRYLISKNYVFPVVIQDLDPNTHDYHDKKRPAVDADIVYYADIEKALKTILTTEIPRYNSYSLEQLEAMSKFLEVVRDNYPYRGNDALRSYLVELLGTIRYNSNWNGKDLHSLVRNLEAKHRPFRSNDSDYIGCKGSQQSYRGFTCGVWTLFHTLTVGATSKSVAEGPKVLKAMHGYVKHFFGCTECSQHFQEMAAKNRLFDVKDNDKAVLWLWISHNEVNLRLAGDVTEDPEYPKIQFPSTTRCPACRLARGAWNLPVVYEYLLRIYGSNNIQDLKLNYNGISSSSPLSNLDIGMLSVLLHMAA